MEWINISEINKFDLTNSILVWQNNLSDSECSRFQRAVYYSDSHIVIYPLTYNTKFKLQENGFYEGYDLEGDWCRITHFSIIEAPISL
jgi:hypothetical protein